MTPLVQRDPEPGAGGCAAHLRPGARRPGGRVGAVHQPADRGRAHHGLHGRCRAASRSRSPSRRSASMTRATPRRRRCARPARRALRPARQLRGAGPRATWRSMRPLRAGRLPRHAHRRSGRAPRTSAIAWPWTDVTLEDFVAPGGQRRALRGADARSRSRPVTDVPSGGITNIRVDGTRRQRLVPLGPAAAAGRDLPPRGRHRLTRAPPPPPRRPGADSLQRSGSPFTTAGVLGHAGVVVSRGPVCNRRVVESTDAAPPPLPGRSG